MGYFETLKLPLKVFWTLNRQVNRLRAECDQRHMRVIGGSQNEEGAQILSEALRLEIDSPVVVTKEFDEDKFLELQRQFMGAKTQAD